MTGGIGFSRDGNNTLKKNRSLLNTRKSNEENPYWGAKKQTRRKSVRFSELQKWKKIRVSFVGKRSASIFGIIGIVALLIILFL